MTYLCLMTLFTSLMICLISHPLALGLILLLQTIMIALLTGLMSLNFWSSYIIFLIMIGGMLILFTYMTSIASNEKFKFSLKMTMFIIPMIPLSILSAFNSDHFIGMHKLKTTNFMMTEKFLMNQMYLNKFLNYPHMMIYLAMIMYLLITLIAVVKITLKNKGTLRQKF
uniref:NADH-ubiquinone oxidoreductase chain 6 n=1 Tax=Chrysomeloidea sp. 8 KM-2017 TaxID=2219302 RepID=A0A346RJ81_9CUCU|nr:NADH dehydrogenase subunit 6 [Chrysomeloidea sp. 8 KM-2017]